MQNMKLCRIFENSSSDESEQISADAPELCVQTSLMHGDVTFFTVTLVTVTSSDRFCIFNINTKLTVNSPFLTDFIKYFSELEFIYK